MNCRWPFVAVYLLLPHSVVLAGPLATDPNALVDDHGIWHGSTPFASGDLTGYIDWAVYDSYHNPAGFSGYSRPANSYLYTYQLYSTGATAVTFFGVDSFGDSLGTFTALGVAGQVPTAQETYEMDWTFDGLAGGEASTGLAFSYMDRPELRTGVALNLSSSQGAAGLVAGRVTMPEPSSAILAGTAAALIALAGLRRRYRT